MSANAVVRARIDAHIKEEATVVLATMGLSLADAFRLMFTPVAREKSLPFDPLIPNAETIEAMKEAIDAGVSQRRRRMNDHFSAAIILKDFYSGMTAK